MITIDIRDRNLLVTLSVPGKQPIKARSGSAFFYNSMELVCIALGACFGGELVKLCASYGINPAVFESLQITLENFIPKITVQHPKDLPPEFIADVLHMAQHCKVSNMLKNQPQIELIENTLPVETLIDDSTRSKCCGG